MKELEWKDDYLLGNVLIDKEHQIFVGLVNKFIVAEASDRNNDRRDRLMMEIQKYAEFHFVSEENYMISLNYPVLKEHQKQHIMLIEQFTLALNYIELGEKTHMDFIEFLVNWFKNHTITQDKKIAAFVNQIHQGA